MGYSRLFCAVAGGAWKARRSSFGGRRGGAMSAKEGGSKGELLVSVDELLLMQSKPTPYQLEAVDASK
jgi:hypothetical protein